MNLRLATIPRSQLKPGDILVRVDDDMERAVLLGMFVGVQMGMPIVINPVSIKAFEVVDSAELSNFDRGIEALSFVRETVTILDIDLSPLEAK